MVHACAPATTSVRSLQPSASRRGVRDTRHTRAERPGETRERNGTYWIPSSTPARFMRRMDTESGNPMAWCDAGREDHFQWQDGGGTRLGFSLGHHVCRIRMDLCNSLRTIRADASPARGSVQTKVIPATGGWPTVIDKTIYRHGCTLCKSLPKAFPLTGFMPIAASRVSLFEAQMPTGQESLFGRLVSSERRYTPAIDTLQAARPCAAPQKIFTERTLTQLWARGRTPMRRSAPRTRSGHEARHGRRMDPSIVFFSSLSLSPESRESRIVGRRSTGYRSCPYVKD